MADDQDVLFPEMIQEKKDKVTTPSRAGAGRERGAYGQKRMMLDRLLQAEVQAAARALVAAVKAGDSTAMRIYWDRVYPRPKSAGIVVDLPDLNNVEDVKRAQLALAARAANGEIPLDEAASMSAIFKDALMSHSLAVVNGSSEPTAQAADARERLFTKLKVMMERREMEGQNPVPGPPETIQ